MQETNNKSNTGVIISAIVAAVVIIGGIAIYATSTSKPADKMVKDVMSKTSEAMTKTDDAAKIAMEKEAMMKKDATSKTSDAMAKDGEAMMKADGTKMTADEMAMMKKDEAMKMEKDGEVMVKDAMSKTGYVAYSTDAITANVDGTNVIFFHAPWCPTCKAGEADINANLDKIPENFQILKTDFDTSTALRQKYGVTSQSTFVKVDKDGNKISVGNGFTKLADIVAFGQK
jgi:thiol-disulfide isomerase/thioredoxin